MKAMTIPVTVNALYPQAICKCLDVDLTGMTSASYSLCRQYERCLLDFEAYITSGQYADEVAMSMAPSPESAMLYTPSPETEAVVARVYSMLAARVPQATAGGETQRTERNTTSGMAVR